MDAMQQRKQESERLAGPATGGDEQGGEGLQSGLVAGRTAMIKSRHRRICNSNGDEMAYQVRSKKIPRLRKKHSIFSVEQMWKSKNLDRLRIQREDAR